MGFPYTFPILFPDGEEATASTYILARMLNRLAQFLRDKPNVTSFLTVFNTEAAQISAALADLKQERTIDAGFGKQLDVLGAIVGQPRESRDDATYRKYIKARVMLNNASGTVEEIYSIFKLISPSDATFAIKDLAPAAFELRVYDTIFTQTAFDALVGFLRLARGAGIWGAFHGMFATRANTFTLDGTSAQALDHGHLSGAAV